jgi:hypothetical protein
LGPGAELSAASAHLLQPKLSHSGRREFLTLSARCCSSVDHRHLIRGSRPHKKTSSAVLHAKRRQQKLKPERQLAQEQSHEHCTYMYAASTCCYLTCHQLSCRMTP